MSSNAVVDAQGSMPVTAVSPLAGLPGMMLLASTRLDPRLSEQALYYRLYRYDPSAGIVEQIQLPTVDESLGSASGAISGDGAKAVINAGGQGIFVVDLTGFTTALQIGEKLAPLSFVSQDAYFSVALSPDGSKALTSRPVPTGEQVISTSTGATSSIAFIPPGGQPPAFSPDGQSLAFVYTAPGSGAAKSIYTVPADGSAAPIKVTPDDVYESTVTWIPDGSGVAYAALDGSWQVRIWSFTSGTEQTVYQAADGYSITDVAVSPDGAWVGYSVYNPLTLQRFVQVSNVNDPDNIVVVPHDDSFADRILGWVAANAWQPMGAIVWPHDLDGNETPVDGSQRLNLSVWPSNLVRCNQMPVGPVSLMVGQDNEPVAPITVPPSLITRTVDESTFPSLEFNDIHADLVANPSAKFRFVEMTAGMPESNVWVHAADPRTIYPSPLEPTGFSAPNPRQLDARIQIVYPHDDDGNLVSVDEATKVNLAVDLFQHGTTLSVPLGSDYAPQLMWAEGNGDMQAGPTVTESTSYTASGNVYPRWVLNDFPVEPDQQYNFMFQLAPMGADGSAFSTIWTHGADARTLLPNPIEPESCIA